ncbi:MAG: lipoyl(octanoyl) transferase LipB, partial [Gammaproteobacteria bacterium WSBS_2016_MAG_OTU1]
MLIFKYLGCQEYTTTWENMRAFCENSDEQTPDEIWLLQHPPVYTLGQAGLAKHLLRENGIPLVQSDRGGQITYHGPGQVIAYTLLNLRRRNLGARALVRILENTVINFLGNYNITANG